MRILIDWLSFTVPCIPVGVGRYDLVAQRVYEGLIQQFGQTGVDALLGDGSVSPLSGRAPYSHSWSVGAAGVHIFASATLSHILIEVSGQGCKRMRELGLLNSLIAAVAERVTRIDLACDIVCDTTPKEFVAQMGDNRFGTRASFTSATGDTEYIGSMKSNRYARVYRYAPPHPRADALRIEHVFRKEAAVQLANAWLTRSPEDVAASIGDLYVWEHPSWEPEAKDVAPIPSGYVPPISRSGNQHWLWTVVAPSLAKAAQAGEIDLAAFMEYVRERIEEL